MIDYAEMLRDNANGVLATRNGEKIETRVFHCLFSEDNKLFFCTSAEKNVYAQLIADPDVSFCAFPRDFNPVLSVNGQAVFVEDLAVRKRAFDAFPMNVKVYGSADNPAFKVFAVEVEEFKTYSPSEGSRTYAV